MNSGYLRVIKELIRESFFIEIFQVINFKRRVKHHHFATPNKITYPGSDHQLIANINRRETTRHPVLSMNILMKLSCKKKKKRKSD